MHDDDAMDRLLKGAMAADVPQLSPAFDARVMRHMRPRRLTSMGRVIIAVYIAAAATTAIWLMRDLPLESIAAALAITVTVAAASSAYGRKLVKET